MPKMAKQKPVAIIRQIWLSLDDGAFVACIWGDDVIVSIASNAEILLSQKPEFC